MTIAISIFFSSSTKREKYGPRHLKALLLKRDRGFFVRQQGEALHVTIFHEDRISGVLGYDRIDQENGIGHMGYWLAQEYNGKGIMTKSVKNLIELGFKYYSLNRIEIRCAEHNLKSRAIPERLGFRQEGTIRRALKVYGEYVDHVIYGLLKEESRAWSDPRLELPPKTST